MRKTTPENLIEQIDTHVQNPYNLVASSQGAWRDALAENRQHTTSYTHWIALKVANDYVLEGWSCSQSFGNYIDSGLFRLYWKHERLARAVEKVICQLVDDYIEAEREIHSDG